MNKINYSRELEEKLSVIKKEIDECGESAKPRLLLHSCCGPCSSYVLEYLEPYFKITVFYFNPCIFPQAEYEHRKSVQKSLIRQMNEKGSEIDFTDADYDHESFLELTKGHKEDPECGERCHICYRQRLLETAHAAKAKNYDYFTTTLTVSPYKNATVLNELGIEIGRSYDICYLVSDFKKKEGYKRSIELCKVYGLYRQDYCGCEFSMHADT